MNTYQRLLEKAVHHHSEREARALAEWRHYRCPRPGVLIAPEREVAIPVGTGVVVVRPVYELDRKTGRCSCKDQQFCDRLNAEAQAAGVRLVVRCKHWRIAQLISVWRAVVGVSK